MRPGATILEPGSSPLTRGKPSASTGRTQWRKAHPRSRGENAKQWHTTQPNKGSSPLTRGKHPPFLTHPRSYRLIPAHAGKTAQVVRLEVFLRAHPRSRGENYVSGSDIAQMPGSSPLTRGKPRRRSSSLTMLPAHPRSRGENAPLLGGCHLVVGSSPLTRGKRQGLGVRGANGGLIPAHAGKTWMPLQTLETIWAHPRSRGENAGRQFWRCWSQGSSPLTRGKHFLTCAFIAQIDQILESLELCAFSESYSSQDVYATDAPRDRVRSIGLAPRSSRGAS